MGSEAARVNGRDRILAVVLLTVVIALTVPSLLGGWFDYNAAIGGAVGAALGLLISRRPRQRSS
jgi:membrane associated rhomboid family serine protease